MWIRLYYYDHEDDQMFKEVDVTDLLGGNIPCEGDRIVYDGHLMSVNMPPLFALDSNPPYVSINCAKGMEMVLNPKELQA